MNVNFKVYLKVIRRVLKGVKVFFKEKKNFKKFNGVNFKNLKKSKIFVFYYKIFIKHFKLISLKKKLQFQLKFN